ncbi:hypothetical protein CVV68_04415 [Arthrobacter livingstonensis]|uniref:Uncharacterized protein n=1 Tax=Arthrobacter livingstonensis TaxID=670078 RepID=A0A2V5LMU1_9MICC|nr:hypothetical protein [Arthrobacter livingstonensis]PYI69040.1 hypothetical protein CVV68_04415 [Arthrobacter livingstonensis]
MRYGVPALLLGWLLTFVLFCLGLTVGTISFTGGGSGLGWYFLPISLVYGFPVAAVIGLPFAILVAWPLRRLRKQWMHVAAHALATGIAFWVVVTALGGWTDAISSACIGLFAAACAAIGRAVVIPLVARRNARPSQPPTGPPTAIPAP